jgi:outer membrane autotransporter protein
MNGQQVASVRNTRLRTLYIAVLAGIASGAYAPLSQSMDFHLNKGQLIATGPVAENDPESMWTLLTQTASAGRTIHTVVFRNSPGGDAEGGVGMGSVIRANGLATILDGGCFSACADAFAGGVERAITRFQLPVTLQYRQTELGIHGASFGGRPVPYPGQEEYLDYYRQMLGADWPQASARIENAHYALYSSGGFLRYFDPAVAAQPTRFCPTDVTSADGNCIDYPTDVTIRSDHLVNQAGYAATDDTLDVNQDRAGDINPDHVSGSLNDAWGVIRVRAGATWALNTGSSGDIVWVNGGTLVLDPSATWRNTNLLLTADEGGRVLLRGGMLPESALFKANARLEGDGTTKGVVMMADGSVLTPHQIAFRPYTEVNGDRSPGYLSETNATLYVADGATLHRAVNTGATEPAIVLEQHEVVMPRDAEIWDVRRAAARAQAKISAKATLALTIAPGFYPAEKTLPIIEGHIDASALALPPPEVCGHPEATCENFHEPAKASDKAFIEGRFVRVERWNDDGTKAESMPADAPIHASDASLLTFALAQSADSISLVALPAFDDAWVFANARVGNGLGHTLSQASHRKDTALSPLLGALQFTKRNVARAQAGVLRGDGYATLQTATVALVRSFDQAIAEHIAAARNGESGRASAMVGGLLSSTMGGRKDFAGGAMGAMARNMAADASTMSGNVTDRPTLWARGFGQSGDIKANDGIAGMRHNASGLVVGADKTLAGGHVLVGGSVGHGAMVGKTSDKAFRADVRAWDMSGYINAMYERGFLRATLRYTTLRAKARRAITGIDGLNMPYKGDAKSHAFSASFEHGLRLAGARGILWEPILPAIDYVRMPAGGLFAESSGPAALTLRRSGYESLRAGVGLRVSRPFSTDNSGIVTPHAQIVATYDFKHPEAKLSANFSAEPSLHFPVSGSRIGRKAIAWNLGVSSRASDRTSIQIDYVGERAGGRIVHGLAIGLVRTL